MLAGEGTRAEQLAMGLVARLAGITGATKLIPITRAHIDGCLYHGQASIDFARTMADAGGQVRVPTTLNVGIIDLLHPELFRGDPAVVTAGREMMTHYRAMGCRQTWTCAPYQLLDRPRLGEQVAWAESNAIVFANSVLGARTERYGDFIDLAAAITGRVPDIGLHRDEGRLGRVLFRVQGIDAAAPDADIRIAALGHFVGRRTGNAIPVVEGVDHATEDQLKAFGAAAASSGSVAMFHMVGVTPEARDVSTAFGGRRPAGVIDVDAHDLDAAIAELSPATTHPLGTVSAGTPHFSFEEFRRLHGLLAGRQVHASIEFFVSTGRDVLARVEEAGWAESLRASGLRILTDTCTYLTPILRERPGAVMTNSAKWAWYAPGNLGYEVIFASLEDCVESAVAGEVRRRLHVAGGRTRAGNTIAHADPLPRLSGEPEGPQVLVAGAASGEVLHLTEPLSFWGGVRESDGTIIDVHHPQQGACVAGRVVVMPGGRGSSSSSSVMAELVRNGSAPAAIIMRERDPILALGAMVGEMLYERSVPVALADANTYARAAVAKHLEVRRDRIEVD